MEDKVQKIREEVEKLKEWQPIATPSLNKLLSLLDTMQEEPVSDELENAADKYSQSIHSDYFNDMFDRGDIYEAVIYGAEWQKENLWKPADGDDLPEIDREVVAFQEIFPTDVDVTSLLKIVIAHRPNKYTKVWNSDLGEEQVVEIERHGKGGWNIPDVKYWLDCLMPKEMEL